MKLLVLGLLMSFSITSYAKVRCSKGYSMVPKAEVAIAAYFNMEDLKWCEDLDKGGKGTYAQYEMIKKCVVEGEAVKVQVMRVFGGPCALDGVIASVGMYTYEYNADIDLNNKN